MNSQSNEHDKWLKPRKRGWVATLFRRYLSLVNHPIYFRHIYTPGRERMPKDGTPVVLVSNHQNCLIDPLALVFILSDRKPRFLARASVFKHPLLDKIIRWLGALPAYRAKFDGIKGVAKNKGTLEEVAKSLSHGETVVLYPEGQHQNKRWLGPFSQAYLKMAFGAAEEAGFEREVYVMPTANHYSHYRLPREDMMILFGKPVALSPYYEEFKSNPREVMAKVNEEVRGQIEGLMLNVEDLDHYEAIDFLRQSEAGEAFARSLSLKPSYLPDKLQADKKLVARLKEATERNPEQMDELFGRVKNVARKMKKLGLRDWLFEAKPSVGGALLWSFLMVVGLPLFTTSIAATWLVFVAPLLVNRLLIKDHQFWGSINLAATLLVTYPLCGLVPVVVMLCCGNWIGGLGYLVAFPLMIIYSSNYMRWATKLLGYVRFVFAPKATIESLSKERCELFEEVSKVVSK
ncbi:MAG: 1-acyl-sn-glycerol-3-phosphate acyltransferase [Tidjanibacter sp.]|nr:1-acyl-sn-glycerol-3-phosphate acyltransferase [Tidjanibacter sp.]